METLTPLLTQAAGLMVMGMVLVFAFLGCLVMALKVMARLFAPAPKSEATTREDGAVDPTLIAAIGAAIHAHRRATER
ncbi:OadG family transporter subunit [Ferrimonas balearica]|uniref:OadG family transporter subunit n=1 Tax=Ferrimonas balearica TaxID=44012 RepID=UPI001C998243|nr:OadG family transporter subunit [Ferrimonas balearica]MBY5921465.1 OadG family protein [Ferrimonas balearica]MBY5995850.1 OadG family protein [Ferrimonas balearica]